MEPILKWAGGKRLLLPKICKYINAETLNGHYLYEPFFGGGSLTFSLEYSKTHINDFNTELINVYNVIKTDPYNLIKVLLEHKNNHSKEYYYKIRNIDRTPEYQTLSNVERAARTIYLNKTCYNGLYRVNNLGNYNVPIGKQTNTDIVMENRILNLSNFLNNKNIVITSQDFELAVASAKKGDVIYFDPPYDYEIESNGFTSYNSSGFTRDDLRRLKTVADKLIRKGCHVLISNNDTEFVNDLFNDDKYSIEHILAHRFINCKATHRTNIGEVLIYG